VIGLDSLINAIQWRHHDVSTEHVPLSEYIAVHDLGLEGTLLFLCPLADPALRADGRHDSTKEPTRIFAKNNPQKNILVSVTKFGRITAVNRTFVKIKTEFITILVLKISSQKNPNIHHINSISVQN
jgi:hypothetical protein